MSTSIELKLREKDVQRQPRQAHISPSALPAFNPEATPDPHVPLEQWVLKAAGAENLGALPLDIARKIIVIDAFDSVLTLREKMSIFAYGLWAIDGNFVNIRRYMGLNRYADINSLVDHVLDNDELAVKREDKKNLGDRAEKEIQLETLLESVEPFSPRDNQDRQRLKAAAEEVIMLDAQEIQPEQILKMRGKIHRNVRIRLRRETWSQYGR